MASDFHLPSDSAIPPTMHVPEAATASRGPASVDWTELVRQIQDNDLPVWRRCTRSSLAVRDITLRGKSAAKT
jgi:hypothetical protein